MKRLLIALFSLPFCVLAQNKPLVIEGTSPGFYLKHLIAPKENYYSVGRMYNISPKEVAPFNNLVLEKGLNLGQTINIPLSASNFAQTGTASPDEVLIPLYHVVEGKESLYHVSTTYNKVPVETLKQWNDLKGDAVANGTSLIVGYLKVKKELSPLAGMAKARPAVTPAKTTEVPDQSVAVTAPVKQEEPAKPEVAIKKETPAEQLPPVKKENPAEPVVEKVKKEPAPEVAVKEPTPEKKLSSTEGRKNFNGGIFKADYEKQVQNKDITGETGEAAVFKSTSGWDDGKYYCLHNTSSPGTIVKITNTSTGKSVYAKVLDTIPDIKQNTGLLVRISNAAAEALGAGDAKFDCTLSYSK